MRIAIICFINDPFDSPGGARIGGGHLVLKELGEYLVSRGEDVTFITRLNDKRKEEFEELGPMARVHRINIGPKTELSPSIVGTMLDDIEKRTRQVLQNANIEALHSQYWIAGEVVRRINKKLRLRHVHHMLSFGRQKLDRGEELGPSDQFRDSCEKLVFGEVDILIAQCPSEANDLNKYYPEISINHLEIIPHGIDSNIFTP